MSNIQIIDANGVIQTISTTLVGGVNTPHNIIDSGIVTVTNFPAVYAVTGSVSIINFPTAQSVTIPTGQFIGLIDAAGVNEATIKPASTAALATDTALVTTEPGSVVASTPASTTVTSTTSVALAANPARREFAIVNTDVVVVYIGLGHTPTATAYHLALKPCAVANDATGGSFISDTWKGAVNVIVASTSGHIAITELT